MNCLRFLGTQKTIAICMLSSLFLIPFACKTTEDPAPVKTVPTVATLTSLVQDQFSFTIQGNVSSDGFDNITARGIVYSATEPLPSIESGTRIDAGSLGSGSFSCFVEGLTTGTTYRVRAFATNSKGTSYGQPLSINTSYGPLAASTINTAVPVLTDPKLILFTASVTDQGGTSVSERGVVIDIKTIPSDPSLVLSNTIRYKPYGLGEGVFSDTVKLLVANTAYYVRSYTRNSAGVSFSSNEIKVTTVGVPVLDTRSIEYVAEGATFKGELTTGGGLDVTAQGFVWGTTTTPTLTNSNVHFVTNGIVTFESFLPKDSFTLGTTYNVRSFATNALGTTYGPRESFTFIPLGAIWKGGIVFYIDPVDGKKGMVVTEADIPDSTNWGCTGDSIGTQASLAAGKANTDQIIGKCIEPGTAAKLCRSYSVSGITNWDLPSTEDWKLIDKQLYRKNLGVFTPVKGYWTSTQATDSKAYSFKLSADQTVPGVEDIAKKYVKLRVRGVKSF